MTATDPVTIEITICRACLDGEGDECHTPECALYLHRVDLPITNYRVVAERADSPVLFEGTCDTLMHQWRAPAHKRPDWIKGRRRVRVVAIDQKGPAT